MHRWGVRSGRAKNGEADGWRGWTVGKRTGNGGTRHGGAQCLLTNASFHVGLSTFIPTPCDCRGGMGSLNKSSNGSPSGSGPPLRRRVKEVSGVKLHTHVNADGGVQLTSGRPVLRARPGGLGPQRACSRSGIRTWGCVFQPQTRGSHAGSRAMAPRKRASSSWQSRILTIGPPTHRRCRGRDRSPAHRTDLLDS